MKGPGLAAVSERPHAGVDVVGDARIELRQQVRPRVDGGGAAGGGPASTDLVGCRGAATVG